MKTVKITAVLLALILCFSLIGCSGGETGGTSGRKLAEVSSENDKYFAYRVIRTREVSDEINDLAKEMRKTLKASFDLIVQMSYDTTIEDYDGNYEILIGNTNRIETEKAKEILEKNRPNHFLDFIIKVEGEKICIYSQNEAMLQKAVEYFIKNYCSSKEAWSKLSSETEIIYEAPLKYDNHTIAGVSLKDFTIVTPRDMEYIYGKEIEALVDYIVSYQGYTLPVTDQRAEASANEILIGDLDREESLSVSVTGENYILKTVNGKLVIKGGNSLALGAGVARLLALIKEKENNEEALILPDDYELTESFSPAADGYSYVWGDEFNGKTLNHDWWVDYNNQASTMYGAKSSSILGGEVTQLATQNTEMSGDGCVTVFATRDGENFYSGQITTYDTMLYKYGILEIRAKLPEEPGCAAFWLNGAGLGYGCMTEYDILENFGSATSFAANIHKWADNSYHTSLDGGDYKNAKQFKFEDAVNSDETLSDDFHVYTMFWDDRAIKFAFDGKVFFEYDIDNIDAVDCHRFADYLIMTCRYGAANYGKAATNESPERVELKVDYVRLYQRSDIPSQLQTPENMDKYNYNGREYNRTYH